MYTDSKVSDLLKELKPETIIGFLNQWNASRNKKQKVYFSYDSTNKSVRRVILIWQRMASRRSTTGSRSSTTWVACDVENTVPLFYELYPGSINDVAQLTCMVDKAKGYGYRNIGFILDRGYFSRKNPVHIEEQGFSYPIMVRGMKEFISGDHPEAQREV